MYTVLADTVVNFLEDLQAKYNEIIKSDIVDKVLDEGRDKTNKIVQVKYEQIKNKVGLGR